MPILFDHFLVFSDFSDFFQCRFWEFQGINRKKSGCDKYKDAVCNQDLRSKIDCAKFRLAVFCSDQGGSYSSKINPSVVNTDDNKCLNDQSLCSEPVTLLEKLIE